MDGSRTGQGVDHVASMAIDHVRLSFHYLDIGDIDGYASLFEQQAVLRRPGCEPVRGRAELERFEVARWRAGTCAHELFDVFGSRRRVAAVGRLVPRDASRADSDAGTGFVDLFVVSDKALILERRSFLFTPSRPHP